MIGPGAMLGGVLEDVRVNDRLTIPAVELSGRSSRSGGPGGRSAESRVITWPTY
jgi:ribosome-associated protein